MPFMVQNLHCVLKSKVPMLASYISCNKYLYCCLVLHSYSIGNKFNVIFLGK